MAMRKLWLQLRPRTMLGRGRWKGTWAWMRLCWASDTAVCRLSRELDFIRPRVGPSAPPAEGSGWGKNESRLEDSWRTMGGKSNLVNKNYHITAWEEKGLMVRTVVGI